MTYKDIIALVNAGYTAGQIGQLAQLEQMPAPATAAPATAAPATAAPATPAPATPAPATAAPATAAPATAAPATPAPDYNAIMAELLGIKQAVQVGNIQQTQQPPVLTPDAILANIIAPKPRGKDD